MTPDLVEYSPQSLADPDGRWSTNIVWKSFELEEWEKYGRLQRKCNRDVSTDQASSFIPSSFQGYIDHRLAVLELEIQDLKLMIAAKEREIAAEEGIPFGKVLPIFGGKDMEEATALLVRAVPPITAREVMWSGVLDSDVGFIGRAEFLIGQELLKEL